MGVCYTSATTSATAATKGCTNAASNLNTSGPLLIGLWDTTLSLFFSLFFGTWCATTYYDKGAGITNLMPYKSNASIYPRHGGWARVLPQTCVCRPSGLHHARRWHHSSVSYSTQIQLAPQSSKLGSCARSASRGTILRNQAIGVYGKTGLTDMASCCRCTTLNSGTRYPFNKLLRSEALGT